MIEKKLETKFIEYIISKKPELKKDRLVRKKSKDRPTHVRFMNGCGMTLFQECLDLFEGMILSYTDEFTGSPLYKGQGFFVDWEGSTIGILFAVAPEGNIERKKLTPKSLGLAGYRTKDSKEFRGKIEAALHEVEKDNGIKFCLISMLDNIDRGSPIKHHPFLEKNLNKVTSDFGEVLAAYKSCVNGCEIYFPLTSNNSIVDYYEDNIPVSAKGRKGGYGVSLTQYKNDIQIDDDVGRFLYSIADHDKDGFFYYGSRVCAEAKLLADWVNGTRELEVETFVKNTSYDVFYDRVNTLYNGLGVPLRSKDSRPRALWQDGNTDPFYFTLNTVIHRYWGCNNTKDITEAVGKLLTNAKFLNIDIVNNNVVTTEDKFEDVKEWQTGYWSRATAAWHNWMNVRAVRETDDNTHKR